MVASLLHEEVVNHEILVFIGRQGNYKTTFFNRLLPPQLQNYFYTKTNNNRLTKDDLLTLSEFAIICLEEIDQLRPSELNQLKAMVTLKTVNERASYGRNKERRPHIASFCGTGNNLRFLTDPTGNRRWIAVEVLEIDDPHTHAIPYDGLYSQALALLEQRFRYWFDPHETELLNQQNEAFEASNLEEELIHTHFRRPSPGERGIFATTAHILASINYGLREPLSPTRVGLVMKKLGYESVRHNGSRGYRVVELTGDEIYNQRKLIARETLGQEG
jgi:predicted P-loop ATPase